MVVVGGKKVIGLKVEIESGLPMKLKGVERRLVLSIPPTCILVKDVKSWLVEKLLYSQQEIKLFLGDTVYEVADFSMVSVFTAFRDSAIR